MLDIKYIREQTEKIKVATRAKGFNEKVVDDVILLDEKRRKLMFDVETLRAERNKFTKEDVEKGKQLKIKLKELENELKSIEDKFDDLILAIPSPAADDVIVGTPEKNELIKTVGKPTKFDWHNIVKSIKEKTHSDNIIKVDLVKQGNIKTSRQSFRQFFSIPTQQKQENGM